MKINVSTVWLAGIGIAAFVLLVVVAGATAWQSGDTRPATGDWTINNPTIVADEASLTVNGNLIINAKLEIYNSYLTINSASDNQYRVNVTSTGTLQMYGSTLTAYNTNYHYSFLVWGSLDINRSSVAEMWGDTTGATPWVGGIQIYKSGAQIRNSNIFNGRTGGIYINNCSATITGCNIYGSGPHGASTTYTYGIYVSGDGMGTATTTRIDGNYIYGNTYISGVTRYGYGVYSQFQGSGDRITNNRIYDNGYTMNMNSQGTQLRLQYSNATVTDNFLGNGSYQLYVQDSSPPEMKNMNFTAYAYSSYTTYGVYASNSTLKFDTCSWYSAYGMGTEYGVYSTGPTFNSSAFLTFKNCNFNLTQTGSYTRYSIYAQYTTIDISSTVINMMYGSTCYGIYSMASSAYGTFLNLTGSTITLASSTSTTYIMYASYSYISVSGCYLTAARTSSTTYGLYGTASSAYTGSLNVTKTYLNLSSTMSTTYGVYAYYTPINMSWTVVELWDPGMSGGTVYLMYTRYYSNLTLSNCTFNETFLPPVLYSPSSPSRYGIYNMYYTSLYMTDCKFNYSGAGNGMYPYYASNYMVYSSQYSFGLFFNSTFNMTLNPTGYYNYNTYMFYPQSYSYLNFTDSKVMFTAVNPNLNAYSYYYYVMYPMSYSHISFLNSMFWINNCTGYYMYGLYSNYCGVSFENSTYLVSDNKIMYTTYYMMLYGYGSGMLYFNNSKYLIVNDRDWNQYNYKYVYAAYAYDMSTYVTNSTIDWQFLSQGPYVAPPSLASVYYYGFYDYSYSQLRDYFVINNTFRITHGVNASGGWLFMPQYQLNVRFSRNYINYTHSSNGGSVWYGSGPSSPRIDYFIDNCTVEYMTKSTQPMRGGIMFNQFSYINLYVNDTKVFMRNDGGFYPFNMFYYLMYAKVYFNNTTLEYNIGGGNGMWGACDASPTGYLYGTDTLRFSNSSYIITTRSEPVLLRSFNFTYYQSGSLIFDNSSMLWNISSPNTVASFLYFYSQSGGNPGLTTMQCINSKLEMTIAGTDSASQMISIAPGAGLQKLDIQKSSLTLTVSARSVTPSTIVYMDGQKGNTMSDLTVKVNGPDVSVDPDQVTAVTGIQLVKSYSTIQNFTIECNGKGRVYGIISDIVSMPVIYNVTVKNAYSGVRATFYSQASVVDCKFIDCKYGVSADGQSNITMSNTLMTNLVSGANVTDRSWLSLVDCTIENAQRSLDITDGTVWSLNSTFDKSTVKFWDANATLIINWKLQLKVVWQNQVVIEGARVTAVNALGGTAISALSDAGGIVPYFFVTEYIQTNFVVKTFYSPYTVTATKNDLNGTVTVTTDKTKEEAVVITDPFDPVVAITEPADNTFQNYTTVALAGTAGDVGSGIDHLSFSYDGTAWTDIPASKLWQFTMMDVPEKTWTIRARVYDVAGNMGEAQITLTIDLTAPFIKVTSPADGSLGNRIGVDLEGSVEPGSVFTVNYRPVALGADGSFRYGLRLVEGKNVLALFARDRAGNTNFAEWTLYLDITPPPLSIFSPADGLLTNQGTTALAGRTEPGATVKVNDAAVTVQPDGSFTMDYTLSRGTNTLKVVAMDAAGNDAQAIRTVVMDDEVLLRVVFPEDGLLTNQITILVTGSTDPDAQVRLNDALVTVGADGNFSVTYTLDEGQNQLAFSARDRAGNAAGLTRKVILDTVAPALEVASPLPGSLWRTGDINVSGICEAGMTLTVNGEAVPTGTGTFAKAVRMAEGSGLITIEGRDAAGNTVSRKVQVIVDLTAPGLEIVEPQTGFRTLDMTVMVVGLTEPGALVKVNDQPVQVDAYGKFTTSVTLRKGANTIKVTTADEAGNSATKSITVKNTETPAPPSSNSWWWSVIGMLLALGLMIPLSMLAVNLALRERKTKEGSQ